ncbi:tetratricopeptide repeat protein [Thiocystis violascens]|uniref:protein O-GlcNAc transferase n=1 Tax=Thiocystis violascens (strain ATCC 17096 / DSM 198 / 6111) TaxID=765911 RepID=I3Y7F0_THIV6|nr:tetratricopeptide repeat protein [Thiocystis violascens]AFL72918.1 putative O-linked N-acetylglucosamine transferase, SPINDLY family [Thiocystis violascens DSM 198]
MTNTADLCNLALSHYRAGRLDVAESLYRAILALDESHAEAHHNLGIIDLQRDRLEPGLTHLRRALALAPEIGGYWLSLAEGLLMAQQPEEARSVIERARAIGLDTPDARALRQRLVTKKISNAPAPRAQATAIPLARQERVVALLQRGQLVEGETAARKLTKRYPSDAFGWRALGTLLFKRDDYQGALTMLQKALSIDPHHAECLNTLGNALNNLGRAREAIDCFNRALEIDPDYAAAHNSKGVALKDLNRMEEAIACYRRALALAPDLAEAHNNLGAAFKGVGRLDEALECHRQALAINPRYAEAYSNLGGALQGLGRLDESIAAYERSLQLNPKLIMAPSSQLFVLNYHPDKPAEEIYAAYRDFDRRYAEPHRASWRAHDNNRDPDRRLRVGYVSPDFRSHSARHFLEPLLEWHDRGEIEATAYAELASEDAVTARYRGYVDHWVATRGLSDEALAERIRADGIDILVDVAGHTANNRLSVFARRPAPISLSWMGYGYTTGLSAIDYFLTDDVMAPPGSENLFAERPWRIPVPSLAYRPAQGMGAVGALPALRRGFVTFGTLTRGIRINHRIIRVWSELLQRLPGARLLIDSQDFVTPEAQIAISKRFAAHGIDTRRLELGFHSPPWDVLRGMDIGLDCFPHNSGTTLIESLYMGVPFITLAERASVGRIGSMMLAGAGHAEWIADSEDDYIEKAVELASDLTRLVAIRAGLRGELEAGPWRDEVGFARRVEMAYREMWRRWCLGDQ